MKGFQFKLNKVLKVRQIEEEQIQNHFIKARKEAEEIEDKIDSLENKQDDLYQFLRNKSSLELNETLLYRNYIQRNRQSIEQSKEELKIQENLVMEKKEIYLEKRKERETLEKLKDKKYNLYQKDLFLKEQKEIDDLAQRLQG